MAQAQSRLKSIQCAQPIIVLNIQGVVLAFEWIFIIRIHHVVVEIEIQYFGFKTEINGMRNTRRVRQGSFKTNIVDLILDAKRDLFEGHFGIAPKPAPRQDKMRKQLA